MHTFPVHTDVQPTGSYCTGATFASWPDEWQYTALQLPFTGVVLARAPRGCIDMSFTRFTCTVVPTSVGFTPPATVAAWQSSHS